MTRINKMGYLIKKEKYFFYYKSNNGEVNNNTLVADLLENERIAVGSRVCIGSAV